MYISYSRSSSTPARAWQGWCGLGSMETRLQSCEECRRPFTLAAFLVPDESKAPQRGGCSYVTGRWPWKCIIFLSCSVDTNHSAAFQKTNCVREADGGGLALKCTVGLFGELQDCLHRHTEARGEGGGGHEVIVVWRRCGLGRNDPTRTDLVMCDDHTTYQHLHTVIWSERIRSVCVQLGVSSSRTSTPFSWLNFRRGRQENDFLFPLECCFEHLYTPDLISLWYFSSSNSALGFYVTEELGTLQGGNE